MLYILVARIFRCYFMLTNWRFAVAWASILTSLEARSSIATQLRSRCTCHMSRRCGSTSRCLIVAYRAHRYVKSNRWAWHTRRQHPVGPRHGQHQRTFWGNDLLDSLDQLVALQHLVLDAKVLKAGGGIAFGRLLVLAT